MTLKRPYLQVGAKHHYAWHLEKEKSRKVMMRYGI